MRFSSITAALLLPLLAIAHSTTTSTSTTTKTVTVLKVVATETSTYHNATSTYASVGTISAYKPTSVGTISVPSPSTQSNFTNAATSYSGSRAGMAGVVVLAVAALL